MERKTFFQNRSTRGGSGNRPETFAIRVTGYDTAAKPPLAKGVRLDNGEEAVVFLRDVDYNRRGRFVRSEIADFAAPRKDRNHPGTSEGGVLLVQEAFKEKNGSWAARWLQSLSHTPGEAEVFSAVVHVDPVQRSQNKSKSHPDGRPYSAMTVLFDGDFSHVDPEVAEKILKVTPPFPVQTVAELREAAEYLMNDGVNFGIRVSSAEGFDAMTMSRKRDQTPEQALEAFMGNVAPLQEAIDGGQVTCEVIPHGRIWGGPATLDVMLENPVVQGRLKKFNGEREYNGKTYQTKVYRPAIVAIRVTEPNPETGARNVYFSHFEPLYTRQPVEGLTAALCFAKTEHLAPEPPRPDAAGNDANAGASAGSDSGSFDAGESDERPVDDSVLDAAMKAAQAGAAADTDIGEDLPEPQASTPPPTAAANARRYAGRRMAS